MICLLPLPRRRVRLQDMPEGYLHRPLDKYLWWQTTTICSVFFMCELDSWRVPNVSQYYRQLIPATNRCARSNRFLFVPFVEPDRDARTASGGRETSRSLDNVAALRSYLIWPIWPPRGARPTTFHWHVLTAAEYDVNSARTCWFLRIGLGVAIGSGTYWLADSEKGHLP